MLSYCCLVKERLDALEALGAQGAIFEQFQEQDPDGEQKDAILNEMTGRKYYADDGGIAGIPYPRLAALLATLCLLLSCLTSLFVSASCSVLLSKHDDIISDEDATAFEHLEKQLPEDDGNDVFAGITEVAKGLNQAQIEAEIAELEEVNRRIAAELKEKREALASVSLSASLSPAAPTLDQAEQDSGELSRMLGSMLGV